MGKKYLCIEEKDIYYMYYSLLLNKMGDQFLIPHTYRDNNSIFEKHNIPKEYQKLFVEYNSLKEKGLNLFSKKIKGYEYFTNAPVVLYKDTDSNDIWGNIALDYPIYGFKSSSPIDEEEIIGFSNELKDKELLNNYLNCTYEMSKINTHTNVLSKKKVMKTTKKN